MLLAPGHTLATQRASEWQGFTQPKLARVYQGLGSTRTGRCNQLTNSNINNVSTVDRSRSYIRMMGAMILHVILLPRPYTYGGHSLRAT